MLIRVDPSASVPVFQQIVDEIKSAIARGACEAGEMIPSVRQLAAQALVNPNTVARAFRDLEREGVVSTRKGLGVFVSENAAKACRQDRREEISEKLTQLAAEARRAGMSDREFSAAAGRAATDEFSKPDEGARKK